MMVSIITPVYNVSGCIRRFIESMLSQTLTDIEVILVDDHGQDESISIAHQITDSYTGQITFRYLETPCNSGPGAARNIGLDAARGKYVAFVDSDDTIDPEFCHYLVESAEHNDSDMCCCHLEIFDENGSSQGVKCNPPVPDGEFSGQVRRQFLSSYVSYFTTFIYRREMLDRNGIRFPAGRSSEDSMMLCCALLCCRRISQVNRYMYRYLRQSGSLTMKTDATRYRQKLDSMNALMKGIRERGWYSLDKDELDFIYYKKGFLVSVFNYIANTGTPRTDVIKGIYQELKTVLPDYRNCPYVKGSLKFRMLGLLIGSAPAVSIWVIRLYLKLKGGQTML
ncbi:MAG: glycosyltransferase [Bacteroidaceae bacterium]|nr:glycosyltransferase [Bacteroidaceae bacterium]